MMIRGRFTKACRKCCAGILAITMVLSIMFFTNIGCYDVKAAENPREQIIIALDPGHSGADSGAVNAAYGAIGNYSEQMCNWRIMSACKDYLEQYEDVTVVVTRKDYESASLSQRVSRIKNADALLSVSFHCNASTSSSVNGCEVYYSIQEPFKTNTKELATDICNGLSKELGLRNGGLQQRPSINYPGRDYLTMIDGPISNGIPGILIEHAYISNPHDASILTNDANLKKMGEIDAKAIAKYFGLTPKAGSNVVDMSGYSSKRLYTTGTLPDAPEDALVAYGVHRQTYGWEESEKYDGQTSGTVGESKRLESIMIRNNTDYEGDVSYQVHCQTYGWTDWVSNGQKAGTCGEGKRLEAIRIKLSGQLAEVYDVYYRVHAQSYGWLGWAKNGETAGTSGFAKRLEAIEIKFVEKGQEAPEDDRKSYVCPTIAYRTHVQTYGWQNYVVDGQTSGTTGLAKRLESISIKNLTDVSGDIEYCVHVQTYGWQNWRKNGENAGTVGQAKRLEAIRIRLTGELEQKYDVYYRVHAQTYGWLGWAKNGEPAGTAGFSKRLEGIQILLVPKGEQAPGSMVNHYVGAPVSD